MTRDALFDALAARPAADVLFQGAGRPWTAGEVRELVEALAVRFTSHRVVAVLADNGPAWAIADLAARRARVVHLPLPAFFTDAQVAHALAATGADLVLTDQPTRFAGIQPAFTAQPAWQGLAWLERTVAPADLPPGTAKISFTSGSTGSPKGVCLTADGLLDTAMAVSARLEAISIESHLAVLPLALLLENVAGLYAPILRGARVHLPSLEDLGWRGMAGFDPSALDRAVAATGASSAILVPELLKAWTLYLAHARRRASPALAFVAVGGARVDRELLIRARAAGLPAYQGYGLTECGSVVTLNVPGDDGGGVGRALAHAHIRIDEHGEVRVATRAFAGYLGGEPRAPQDEHATGDLGTAQPDGHLALSGRRGNLLITSFGRNVSPEWVESILLAQPAIAQAVVAGEGEPALRAVLVATPGFDRHGVESAVGAANTLLPDYARIAGFTLAAPFTTANGLATGNGRPLRRRILETLAASAAPTPPENPTHAVH